jgi:hypothetical protein
MGMSYCSASATDANHSEWTRAFASTPDNHNGLVAFKMTPSVAVQQQLIPGIITKKVERDGIRQPWAKIAARWNSISAMSFSSRFAMPSGN